MDPNFNSVWSASEIDMVKSFIASHHNTNNTYTTDTNEKHNDIVDELQAMFPCKEKLQVIQLCVELAAAMNTIQSINQQVVASMPTEDINIDNMDMFHGHIMDDVEAMKVVEEQPHRLNTVPKKKRQHPVITWTQDEHKNFLRGLEVFGRGNWKDISKYFVPTRTPIQICSHAQKYFQRKTTRKQRFSINDVGLYDTEPWVHKNSSSSEALAFSRSAYNTNYYDSEGQHVVLNKLAHANQGSSSHVATWTTSQHIIASPSIDPMMVRSNSHGWEALPLASGANNTNYYEFDGQVSNNQVATWTRGQHTTTSSSVAPVTVHNTYPSWEVPSFVGSAYNTNYNDFDGQVALNNTTREQPW